MIMAGAYEVLNVANPWSSAEIGHSRHIAMYWRGAALAALGIADKDVVAAGSSANLTEHAAESGVRLVGPSASRVVLPAAF